MFARGELSLVSNRSSLSERASERAARFDEGKPRTSRERGQFGFLSPPEPDRSHSASRLESALECRNRRDLISGSLETFERETRKEGREGPRRQPRQQRRCRPSPSRREG